MGRLFDLIDDYKDGLPHRTSYAAIAESVGVSRQTLLNWRAPAEPMDPEKLERLARVIRRPYMEVLAAVLEDTGYLHHGEVIDPDRGGSGLVVDDGP